MVFIKERQKIKMIVHLFPKSQFTEEFVQFINGHFNKQEHVFLVYTNKPFELSERLYEQSNVIDMDKKELGDITKILQVSRMIIFHNLSVNFDLLFMFWIHRSWVKKSLWLVWGSDLYSYRIPKKKLMEHFVEYMKRGIIQNLPIIATLADGDYQLAKQWYGAKGNNVRLDYCEEYTINLLNKLKNSSCKEQNGINVLLGNSATVTNQHEEALSYLKKFAGENIRIITPLSYGDMEYGEKIISLGKSLFGEKFIPLTNYMSRDEYYEILNSVDIALFNNDRQQATGNITALLYLKKKVYLRADTSMWDEWVNKEGYELHDIRDIEKETFSTFCNCEISEINQNEEIVNHFFNVESRKREWETVFEGKWL